MRNNTFFGVKLIFLTVKITFSSNSITIHTCVTTVQSNTGKYSHNLVFVEVEGTDDFDTKLLNFIYIYRFPVKIKLKHTTKDTICYPSKQLTRD